MCKYLNECYLNIVVPMTYNIKLLMYEYYMTTEAEIFSAHLRMRLTMENFDYNKYNTRNYNYGPDMD